MNQRTFLLMAALSLALHFGPEAQAQPLVTIETVTVGDPGNAPDTSSGSSPYPGAVTNLFAIGKYEVTINQYTAFLNSVARTNTNSYIVDLWSTNMTNNGNIAGIGRSGSGTQGDPYSYSPLGSGNRPIAYVSWFDAARFANWLHNGATNGASTETGAYTLDGATNGGGFFRNAGAKWWIPSINQWYKAAYYKGGGTNAGYWQYPTRSDIAPGNVVGGAPNQANYRLPVPANVYAVTQSSTYFSGTNYLTDVGAFSNSASAYGTYDQGGNLWEWNDYNDGVDSPGTSRNLRGGSWGNYVVGGLKSSESTDDQRTLEDSGVGFRLAALPSFITSAATATGTVGRPFVSYQITANNSPSTFGATGLPSGLSVNTATGLISGSPTQAGVFNATISANNPGSGTVSAPFRVTVAKGSQTITFRPAATQKFKKGRKFTLTATANSKLPVSFKSSNAKILSIKGKTATIRAKGKVTVTASQAGNANYLPAKAVKRTITIR